MTGNELAELLEPVLGRLGYELADLEVRSGGKGGFVRVFIDKPDGIDLDDCERVSLAVSALLDVEGTIDVTNPTTVLFAGLVTSIVPAPPATHSPST